MRRIVLSLVSVLWFTSLVLAQDFQRREIWGKTYLACPSGDGGWWVRDYPKTKAPPKPVVGGQWVWRAMPKPPPPGYWIWVPNGSGVTGKLNFGVGLPGQ